jgi:predicted flap endonuclease-1-like 5' DNA nuclease
MLVSTTIPPRVPPTLAPDAPVNGLTLLVLIALAIGLVFAYRAGRIAGRREARAGEPAPFSRTVIDGARIEASSGESVTAPPAATLPDASDAIDRERSRLVVAWEAEAARLRAALDDASAKDYEAAAFAEDRHALLDALAAARGDTARYRQLVVDFETNAPPTLLGGPGAPDDLKLIVGVGPMLERMLHQLGVTTFRQIAHWSERDIDDHDAKLPEFPGRIRRDGWVVQARELHQSKYGERP